MRFNNGAADGKPHSQSLTLGCEKRVEQSVFNQLGDPWTVVLYQNLACPVACAGCDGQQPAAERKILNRVHPVVEEVEKHLLKRYLIALDDKAAIGEIQTHLDLAHQQDIPHQTPDFLDGAVQVQILNRDGLLLQNRSHTVDDGTGPAVVVGDLSQSFTDL